MVDFSDHLSVTVSAIQSLLHSHGVHNTTVQVSSLLLFKPEYLKAMSQYSTDVEPDSPTTPCLQKCDLAVCATASCC
jgi:hypothetical protein